MKQNRKAIIGVLGSSFLIALPAFSQPNPANPPSQVNIRRDAIIRNPTLNGSNNTYPQGSRINSNGIISTPRGKKTLPSVRVKHGDGSTSYYYRDGSRIIIDDTSIPPTGKPIR